MDNVYSADCESGSKHAKKTHKFATRKIHKLRGSYLRIFVIGEDGFSNEDPVNETITNEWGFDQLVDILLPVQENADNEDEFGYEFKLVINDKTRKFTSQFTLTYRSPCRSELLSTLRFYKLIHEKPSFRAKKVIFSPKGKGGDRWKTSSCWISLTPRGLCELNDQKIFKHGEFIRYVDVGKLQRVSFLPAKTLRVDGSNSVSSGFVVCNGLEKKPTTYLCAESENILATIKANFLASAIRLHLPDEVLYLGDLAKIYEAYYSPSTWGLTLLDVDALNAYKHNITVHLSEKAIVEVDNTTHNILSVRLIECIKSLVVDNIDPKRLEICFHSSEERRVYFTDQRVVLAAHILDLCNLTGIHVLISYGWRQVSQRVVSWKQRSPFDYQTILLRRVVTNSREGILKGNITHANGIDSNSQWFERLLRSCYDFIENSDFSFDVRSPSQTSVTSDILDVSIGRFVLILNRLLQENELAYQSISVFFETIIRLITYDGVTNARVFNVEQVPEIVSLIFLAINRSGETFTVWQGVRLLEVIIGGSVIDYYHDMVTERSNKQMLLSTINGNSILASLARNLGRATTNPLACMALASVLERVIVSGRETSTEEAFNDAFKLIIFQPNLTLNLLVYGIKSVSSSVALLMHTYFREAPIPVPDRLVVVQDEALRRGYFLSFFRQAAFDPRADVKLISRFLLTLFVYRNQECFGLLRRILPRGMSDILGDDYERFCDVHPSLGKLGGKKVADLFPTLNSFYVDNLESIQRVYTEGYLKNEIPTAKNDILGIKIERMFQVMDKNWELPDLVWNNGTREELASALDSELSILGIRQGLFCNVLSSSQDAHGDTDQNDSVTKIEWNHLEFAVKYKSLSEEECVGGFYLRPLMLLQATSSIPSLDDSTKLLSNPCVLFENLFRQFLKCFSTGKELLASQCLQAMRFVYSLHRIAIGEFEDIVFLVDLLYTATSDDIRIRIAALVSALCESQTNSSLLVLHAADCIPKLYTMLQLSLRTRALSDPSDDIKEWFYRNPGSTEKNGPVSLAGIRLLIVENTINVKTVECWAEGMDRWELIDQNPFLRLSLSRRVESERSVSRTDQCGFFMLQTLIRVCQAQRDASMRNIDLQPPSKAFCLISSVDSITVLSQNLLSDNPEVVISASDLLLGLIEIDQRIASRVYWSGALYFAFSSSHGIDVFRHIAKMIHAASVRESSPVLGGFKNILLTLIPEPLYNILLYRGPAVFAETFVGSFQSPEAIWSPQKRESLRALVVEHIGSFINRLAQNPYLQYVFVPMPPVFYDDFSSELYIGGYFLRLLCYDKHYENWEISNPVALLSDLLQVWSGQNSVMESSSLIFDPKTSVIEARKLLELPEGKVNSYVVRANFRCLAEHIALSKKSNDHNKFDHLLEAYCLLQRSDICSLENSDRGGNLLSCTNLDLILETQLILFSKFDQVLSKEGYRGFEMLIRCFTNEWLKSRAKLIVKASKLLLLVLNTEVNIKEFCSFGGMENLVQTLKQGVDEICGAVSRTGDLECMELCKNFLQSFVVLSSRKVVHQVLEKKQLSLMGPILDSLKSVLREAIEHTMDQLMVQYVLRIVSRLVGNPEIQAQVVEAGMMWYIVPFIFQYDNASREDQPRDNLTLNKPIKAQMNLSAKHAVRAIARMGGYLNQVGLVTTENAVVKSTADTLFTPQIARLLSQTNPTSFLNTLCSDFIQSPTIVWNQKMKNTVQRFVRKGIDNGIAFDALSNRVEAAESHDFTLGLDDEPCVDGIYIRFLIEAPSADCISTRATPQFCTNLLLQLKRMLSDNGDKTLAIPYIQAFGMLFSKNRKDSIDSAANALVLGDSSLLKILFSALSDEVLSTFALDTLIHVVTISTMRTYISSRESYLLEVVQVFETLEENSAFMELILCLCLSTNFVEMVFLLSPKNASVVIKLTKYPPYIRLLRIAFDSDNNTQLRMTALKVLGTACGNVDKGTDAFKQLQKYLPRGFVALLCRDTAKVLQVFELNDFRSPELVWTANMRQVFLSALGDDDADRAVYEEKELVIGNVYVEVYLAQPRKQLQNPSLFLNELLAQFSRMVLERSNKAINQGITGAVSVKSIQDNDIDTSAGVGKANDSKTPSPQLRTNGQTSAPRRSAPPVPSRVARNGKQLKPQDENSHFADLSASQRLLREIRLQKNEAVLSAICAALVQVLQLYPNLRSHADWMKYGLRITESLKLSAPNYKGFLFKCCLVIIKELCSDDAWTGYLGEFTTLDETLFFALSCPSGLPKAVKEVALECILALVVRSETMAHKISKEDGEKLFQETLDVSNVSKGICDKILRSSAQKGNETIAKLLATSVERSS